MLNVQSEIIFHVCNICTSMVLMCGSQTYPQTKMSFSQLDRSRKLKSPAQGYRVRVGPDLFSDSLTLELILLTIKLSCLVKLCVGGGGRSRLHFCIYPSSKFMHLPISSSFLPIMMIWSDWVWNNKHEPNSSSQYTLRYTWSCWAALPLMSLGILRVGNISA